MSMQMVDGDQRQPPRPGERLRRRDADEQRADQAGLRRHRDRVRLVTVERLLDHGRDQLEMPATRNLGHDAAEARMQLVLRRDHARDDLAVVGDERGGGLVAARLDPEDHDCRASRHMISASSRLSV